MDIKPSEAAINDRAINYVLMGRGAFFKPAFKVDFNCTSSDLNLNFTSSPQKPSCSPLWDHRDRLMSLKQGDQSPLVQAVALPPPLPLDVAPCPLSGSRAGRRGGWFQQVFQGTCRLVELWRRMTRTRSVETRTYCVSKMNYFLVTFEWSAWLCWRENVETFCCCWSVSVISGCLISNLMTLVLQN